MAPCLGVLAAARVEAKQASGDWSTPGLAQPDDMQQRFSKLSNGTKVPQLADGKGRRAEAGDRVQFEYVLRRSNGYFIYSCAPGSLSACGQQLAAIRTYKQFASCYSKEI